MGAEQALSSATMQFCAGCAADDFVPEAERATFEGYRRANGKAGTRNYLGILTSVNCSATVAKFMAEEINRSGMLDDYPEDRRRHPARARQWLRHGHQGRRLRGAAAHPMGLCRQSQYGRRADGGAGLRGLPDRPLEGGLRHRRERHLPHHDHPGDRRHQEDDRVGRRAHQGDAADRRRAPGARRCRPPS